jgi:hypothetical protein
MPDAPHGHATLRVAPAEARTCRRGWSPATCDLHDPPHSSPIGLAPNQDRAATQCVTLFISVMCDSVIEIGQTQRSPAGRRHGASRNPWAWVGQHRPSLPGADARPSAGTFAEVSTRESQERQASTPRRHPGLPRPSWAPSPALLVCRSVVRHRRWALLVFHCEARSLECTDAAAAEREMPGQQPTARQTDIHPCRHNHGGTKGVRHRRGAPDSRP